MDKDWSSLDWFMLCKHCAVYCGDQSYLSWIEFFR